MATSTCPGVSALTCACFPASRWRGSLTSPPRAGCLLACRFASDLCLPAACYISSRPARSAGLPGQNRQPTRQRRKRMDMAALALDERNPSLPSLAPWRRTGLAKDRAGIGQASGLAMLKKGKGAAGRSCGGASCSGQPLLPKTRSKRQAERRLPPARKGESQ